MKTTLWAIVLIAVLTLRASAGTYYSQTFDTGLQGDGVIPDGSLNGWSDTRTVTGDGIHHVADVRVTLTISNGYNADLYAYLAHRSGVAVLLNRVGLASTNAFGYDTAGLNVTFSAAAANNVHFYGDGSPSYDAHGWLTGTWQPDARGIDPLSALSAFDAAGSAGVSAFTGLDPNGEWTLFVADVSAGAVQGTVLSWGLQIDSVTEPAMNLFITSVNGGTAPIAGTPFSVTVEARDVNGVAANVTADTAVTLSLKSGDGVLGGTLTGTILSGTSSATITGVTYSKAQSGVELTATRTSGDSLIACDSGAFAPTPGAFAQLQVLMPGETADPGSATGKTGSPTAQAVATAFNVTVNAVDANWNLISTNDTVAITSSDSGAMLPPNAALSGGTGTFSVTCLTAGSQTVTASDVTHTGITSNTGSATTVNKGDQSIAFTSPGDQTYGVAPITLSATAASGLPVSYSVTDGPASVVASTLTISGAGSVTIQASQAGNANWNAAPPVSRTISVAQKSLTPSIAANNRTYDGTTSATISSRQLTGVINSDDVSLTGGTATFGDRTAVTGKTVTATGLSLAGTKAGNYVLSSTTATTTADITPKALTMSGLSVPASKVYDGTTAAGVSGTSTLQAAETAGAGTTSDGIPYSGDEVSVAGTAAGTYNSKDVTAANAVSYSGLSLAGNDAGNYSLTIQSAASATITAKTLVVSGLGVSDKVYDGTTASTLSGTAALLTAESPGAGSTSDGKPYTGDEVTLGGTAAGTFANEDAGNGTGVTISGNSLGGAQAGNYALAANEQSGLAANITKKALTMSGLSVPASKIYDGTTAAVVGGTPALQAAEAAGSGTTSDGKPYSGDQVSLTGTVAGTYNSKDVPTAASVSCSGLSLTGNEAGNYTLTVQGAASATITVKTLLVTGLSANNKAYDDTTAATLSGTAALLEAEAPGNGSTADGKPYTGDTVNLAGTPSGTFATKNLGTGIAVTVSGNTLTGAEASDYTLAANEQPGLTADIVAGVAAQLAFTTQPGSASAGSVLGQQPVVKVQDQYGNETTSGLAEHLTVTMTLSSGTGTLLGTTTLDIGTAGGSGTVSFTNLRIDAAGTKQLTASASGLTSAVSATFDVANVAPVASTATFPRPRNVPLKLRISELLTNATDLNGDTLRLAGVSATSTGGATILTNGTYVLYNLPPGGNVDDSFTYTVSDGQLTASGTVLISIRPDATGTNCNLVAYGLVNGKPTITFAGVPGYTYAVQRTQSLTGTPTWTGLATTNAPAAGLFQYTDQEPPVGNLFYRAQNQ
jgi:hypothetical protein